MKKIKDYSDEDDYEVDDPEEVERDEEEWTPPEAGTESGSFVLAKADLVSSKNKTPSKGKSDVEASSYPTLWRIDGKALLQKFLPFEKDGKVLYKSTTTYSGWQLSNKDNYLAVQVTFKVQSRQETIVELHFDPTQQQEVVKEEKED
ncbi:hypothetical protein DMN91_012703 [Ooceraea biroi]|uniref:Uncharacterized protein n=1 Tax=Ooceraea biroi TaxID=2015173 RepID=A0A3L8D3J2_OOCBI|nr:hypothetical protein DMN91_012703 [Ooceraea biroi]